MAVMIGVDPHKRWHTAVAIDRDEVELTRLRVRASRQQVDELLKWAARFEDRTWVVESADGLGYLLAQQLVATGERVLDVPATLAARVRVLASGRSSKNDPNDGYSIAVAALRAPALDAVARADHGSVLRLLAKRNHQLGSARTAAACRLYGLFFIHHRTRRVFLAGITTEPARDRVTQCARNATEDLRDATVTVRYLLRDRDDKFGPASTRCGRARGRASFGVPCGRRMRTPSPSAGCARCDRSVPTDSSS